MANLRLVLSIALPSVTALIGFLYFLGRKKGKGKYVKAIEEKKTKDDSEVIGDGAVENHTETTNHKTPEQTCQNRRRERDKETKPITLNPEPVEEANIVAADVDSLSCPLPKEDVAEMNFNPPDKCEEMSNVPLNWADAFVEDTAEESVPNNQLLLKDELTTLSSARPAEDVPQSGSIPVNVNCSPKPDNLSSRSVKILTRSPPGLSSVNTSHQSMSSSSKALAKPIGSSQDVGAKISCQDFSSLGENSDQISTSGADKVTASVCDPQISASKSQSVESDPGCDARQSASENSTCTSDSSSASVVIEDSSDASHTDVVVPEKLNSVSSCEQTSPIVCEESLKQGSSTSSAISENTLLTNSRSKMADSSVAADAVQCAEHNGSAAVAGSSESPGCDSNSEASNDSGRGGSVTEPLPLPMMTSDTVRYEFNFPSELCGRLIGKNGRNINLVKEKSGANIALKNNPCTPSFQICVIEGSQMEIDKALVQIRKKFPRGQFPQVDLTPMSQVIQEAPVLMPDIMQLNLPEGVSVDIVVSNIVDAGHIFVQQPTHPTFPSLERLHHFMNACYTQDHMVPPLPRPIEVGVICAAFMVDGWFRAQVVNVCENSDEVDIKYVDYGGYARLQASTLKQIRSDFMTLPFQAVECYMGNITPLQEEEYFSEQGSTVLDELTQGKLLQAQVVNRAEDCIPYIHIYQISGNRVLFINREMVNRKVVRWIEILQ